MQVKIKDLEDDLTYYLTPNGGWSFVSGDLLRHMLLQSGLSEDTEITVKGVLVEEAEMEGIEMSPDQMLLLGCYVDCASWEWLEIEEKTNEQD